MGEFVSIPFSHLEDMGSHILGQGAYGHVYKAKWEGGGGGQIVAVKEVYAIINLIII